MRTKVLAPEVRKLKKIVDQLPTRPARLHQLLKKGLKICSLVGQRGFKAEAETAIRVSQGQSAVVDSSLSQAVDEVGDVGILTGHPHVGTRVRRVDNP